MTLDIAAFRVEYPEFADETTYPDSTLNTQYAMGECFIADNDCVAPEKCRGVLFDLMLAHLLYIKAQISAGNNPSVVTSASEGAVSVSLAEPPTSSNFDYWLNSTPYGRQILAMLTTLSAGGFIVGGLPERYGFRKIGGVF